MKSLKSIVAVLALLGASHFMSAQKIAHINVQQLIENHPDMLSANKQLETIAGTYDKDYAMMVTELLSCKTCKKAFKTFMLMLKKN